MSGCRLDGTRSEQACVITSLRTMFPKKAREFLGQLNDYQLIESTVLHGFS